MMDHLQPFSLDIPYPILLNICPLSQANRWLMANDWGDGGTSSTSYLLSVTTGTFFCQWHNTTLPMTTGSVAHLDSRLRLRLHKEDGAEGMLLIYRTLLPAEEMQEGRNNVQCLHPASSRFHGYLHQLSKSWPERKLRPLRCQRVFLELLEQWTSELYMGDESGHWLNAVREYMHAHFHQDLSREELSLQSGISPAHFSRTFTKQMGVTYSRYLNLLRIRNVQEHMLSDMSDVPLQDLAQENGYSDAFSLSRTFKQLIGQSPSHYRQGVKRVAATSYNHTAMLLLLGIEPIYGAYPQWNNRPHSHQHGSPYEYFTVENPEHYAHFSRLQPDLIIGYSELSRDWRLRLIAPIIALPFMSMNWKQQFLTIARSLSRLNIAEQWLMRYEARVHRLNQHLDTHLPARGTVMLLELSHDAAYVFGRSFGRGGQVLYDDLGFQIMPQLIERNIEEKGFLALPLNHVSHYDADFIVISSNSQSESVKHLLASTSWQSLVAVKNKQVLIADKLSLFYGFDPQSSWRQLRLFERLLTRLFKPMTR